MNILYFFKNKFFGLKHIQGWRPNEYNLKTLFVIVKKVTVLHCELKIMNGFYAQKHYKTRKNLANVDRAILKSLPFYNTMKLRKHLFCLKIFKH